MNDQQRFIAVTAKSLIDRHGIEAARIAAARAEAKRARGDGEAAAVWRLVLAEIERLQATGV